ncbi:hypothetical protein ACJ73_00953 [Blastomyces percursus]|uniref:Uncharacterized protein n=1 Tax=Blastomyces percursus TaxID=1658174 RepID=A0A1J9RI38_9EURO|nr:hypothetical protein ACJ73_00953 [Blastomyces percursus]
MALLEQEVNELRAANTKHKRKREKSRTWIAQEGALGVEEGLDRVQKVNEWEQGGVKTAESQPRKRAAPRCSVCGIIGHTALDDENPSWKNKPNGTNASLPDPRGYIPGTDHIPGNVILRGLEGDFCCRIIADWIPLPSLGFWSASPRDANLERKLLQGRLSNIRCALLNDDWANLHLTLGNCSLRVMVDQPFELAI